MNINFELTTYRIIGALLVLIGITGYLTVADELRHYGEFLGVTGIFVSGLIFLLIDLKLHIFRNIALQWIAIFLLACIPFGAIVLNNLPLGLCIGLIFGVVSAFIFRPSKNG